MPRVPAVIPCLCDKEHQPIDIEWDNEGNPVGAVNGNVHCWFGLFDYLTKDLHDPKQKLIQNFNITEKKFGKQNRSDKKIKKTIGNWCKAVRSVTVLRQYKQHRNRPTERQ